MLKIAEIKTRVRDRIGDELGPFGFQRRGGACYRRFQHGLCVVEPVFLSNTNAAYFATNTATFNLNVGIYFSFIESIGGDADRIIDGEHAPSEYACHLRACLLRKYKVRAEHGSRRDLWMMHEFESRSAEIEKDLTRALLKKALPWFAEYTSLHTAYRTIAKKRDGDATAGKIFGLGAIGCPWRQRLLAGFDEAGVL